MKKEDLKQSAVIFNEEPHEYVKIGENFEVRTYTGVTTVLGTVLFPGKYAGVKSETLKAAAARGTRVHELCQATDGTPTAPQIGDEKYRQEVESYKKIKALFDIEIIENEYLVSDEVWGVASKIDCVDSSANLYDIKTTSSIDTEYLSWQLSFYAEMFEYQNNSPAGKLFGIWLRGDSWKLVEVPRKSRRELDEVVEAYRNGVQLPKGLHPEEVDEIFPRVQALTLAENEAKIKELKEKIAELETERGELLKEIEGKMTTRNLKSVENEGVKITLVEASTTKKLDAKRLEKEEPEIYARYITETERKGYAKITFKK